jgi:hypothetical protein
MDIDEIQSFVANWSTRSAEIWVRLPSGLLYSREIAGVKFQLLALRQMASETVVEVGWAEGATDGNPGIGYTGGGRSRVVFEFRFRNVRNVSVERSLPKTEYSVKETLTLSLSGFETVTITDHFYQWYLDRGRFVDNSENEVPTQVNTTFKSGEVRFAETFVLWRAELDASDVSAFAERWRDRSVRLMTELNGSMIYGSNAKDDRNFQLLGLIKTNDETIVDIGWSHRPALKNLPRSTTDTQGSDVVYEFIFPADSKVTIERVVSEADNTVRERLELTISSSDAINFTDRLYRKATIKYAPGMLKLTEEFIIQKPPESRLLTLPATLLHEKASRLVHGLREFCKEIEEYETSIDYNYNISVMQRLGPLTEQLEEAVQCNAPFEVGEALLQAIYSIVEEFGNAREPGGKDIPDSTFWTMWDGTKRMFEDPAYRGQNL